MHNYDEEPNYICHQCIDDEYLKKLLKLAGARAECNYCRKKNRKVVPLPWLAEKVHDAIGQHYQPGYTNTPDGWEPDGEPVNYLIQEMAEVDEPVANDVQEYLSFHYGPNPSDCYEDDPYGDEAYYVVAPPDDSHHRESWRFFCQEVTQKSRFFNPIAETALDGLFGDIASLNHIEGKSVIRVAGPGTQNEEVFRARNPRTTAEFHKILAEPVTELAAPPFKSAGNGRMNAAGISVFYGVASAKTCIAEVRPPVGSAVVVGRFQIIRKLRLLDFNVLSKVYAKGSVFDPEFAHRAGQAAFFGDLVKELIRPVLPGEETYKYLPTQIVAEYLAMKVKPKLDGIIFRSTQADGSGENIVLFQECSTVEPYILPKGTKFKVSHGRWANQDDFDNSIIVEELVPTETKESPVSDFWKEQNVLFNDVPRAVNPSNTTLRLDVENDVMAEEISGVNYDCSSKTVSRYRINESDRIKNSRPLLSELFK